MEKVSNLMLGFVNDNFAWLYLIALPLFVLFLAMIACSRYGKIRLCKDGEKPEYSFVSWFTMLFCGGTGIGLVFWSIAEPLSHYTMPPEWIAAGTPEAANFSIRTVFFHWGIMQWACFAAIGLPIAYFCFRKGKGFKISPLLEPLVGNKANGWLGKIIDIYAIIVSVAGIATSLGLGSMQIAGGLDYVFGIPKTNLTYLAIICIVTALFTLSALSGINRGIKFLSKLNTVLALVLLVIGFLVCSRNEAMLTMMNGIGEHLQYFVIDCLGIDPYGDNAWVLNWRVFYWAWYVAWTPFVGMFIARISRGRTIREFVVGSVLAPTLFTIIWFSIFGNVALGASNRFDLEHLKSIASDASTAVFKVFEGYGIVGTIMSLLVICLLAIFFITSADSATYSISMLSANGSSDTRPARKIVFALIESALAGVLLITGGLKSLQTISIVCALPFVIIMIIALAAFYKELRKEAV